MKISLPLTAFPLIATASAYNIGGGPLFYRTTTWPVTRRLPSVFDSVSPFGLLSLRDDGLRLQQRQNLLQQQVGQLNRAFQMEGAMPEFRVQSDDSASIVSVDVPGMDVDVRVDDEQRLLTIRGKREMVHNGVTSVREFARTFQVDDRARLDELHASLNNGVLTVRAPKDPPVSVADDGASSAAQEEEEDETSKLRRIPIEVSSATDKSGETLEGPKETAAASGDEPGTDTNVEVESKEVEEENKVDPDAVGKDKDEDEDVSGETLDLDAVSTPSDTGTVKVDNSATA